MASPLNGGLSPDVSLCALERMGRKKGAAEAAPLKMVTAPRVAWMEKQKAAALLVDLAVLL